MEFRILWIPGFYGFPEFMDSRILWIPKFYGLSDFMDSKQWLTSGTVPDRYPGFFTCPTTRSIKIVCPTGIEFSKSSNQYPADQCNGLSLCSVESISNIKVHQRACLHPRHTHRHAYRHSPSIPRLVPRLPSRHPAPAARVARAQHVGQRHPGREPDGGIPIG